MLFKVLGIETKRIIDNYNDFLTRLIEEQKKSYKKMD